nr:hypothetical protein Iba_chr07cCG8930 [Ipomoea batatas]
MTNRGDGLIYAMKLLWCPFLLFFIMHDILQHPPLAFSKQALESEYQCGLPPNLNRVTYYLHSSALRTMAAESCAANEAAAHDIQIQFHLSTSQLLDMSACAGDNNIDFIFLFFLFLLIVKDEPAAADFIHRRELLAIA